VLGFVIDNAERFKAALVQVGLFGRALLLALIPARFATMNSPSYPSQRRWRLVLRTSRTSSPSYKARVNGRCPPVCRETSTGCGPGKCIASCCQPTDPPSLVQSTDALLLLTPVGPRGDKSRLRQLLSKSKQLKNRNEVAGVLHRVDTDMQALLRRFSVRARLF
jgi:hypothetical protein